MAAANLCHASAAQQLLLLDPWSGSDANGFVLSPVRQAALQRHGGAVLKLLLAAAPDLAQSICEHEYGYCHDWTLMHSVASSGNIEGIRLLLQLAPELATAVTDIGSTPMHEAASSGSAEAVRLLFEAAPAMAAAADSRGRLPMHEAAGCDQPDALRVLLEAGAPGVDIVAENGGLPLHMAVKFSSNETSVRLLLAAYPAAAMVRDEAGRTPLQLALYRPYQEPPIDLDATRALLPVSGLSAAQLLKLLAAAPVQAQPLYADLAAHLPLTPRQWQRVPVPCPALAKALPAVLARSQAEAALLVSHLPATDTERLRVAALSLHRLQHHLQLEAAVPAALVGRILALALAGSEV